MYIDCDIVGLSSHFQHLNLEHSSCLAPHFLATYRFSEYFKDALLLLLLLLL